MATTAWETGLGSCSADALQQKHTGVVTLTAESESVRPVVAAAAQAGWNLLLHDPTSCTSSSHVCSNSIQSQEGG